MRKKWIETETDRKRKEIDRDRDRDRGMVNEAIELEGSPGKTREMPKQREYGKGR